MSERLMCQVVKHFREFLVYKSIDLERACKGVFGANAKHLA